MRHLTGFTVFDIMSSQQYYTNAILHILEAAGSHDLRKIFLYKLFATKFRFVFCCNIRERTSSTDRFTVAVENARIMSINKTISQQC